MPTLRELLLDSRDGEWGKGEPFDDAVEMAVIRGTDFAQVRLGQIDRVPTRFLQPKHAARKALQDWDILIETAGGTVDQPTGRTLLLSPSRRQLFSLPVTCASFARFLRIDRTKASPEYIFWLLQHEYVAEHIRQFHTQHTGVARFQYTIFAETHELALPTREVQDRVGAALSAYDQLIQINQRRISILEDMAKRLFQEWFVRLRYPEAQSAPSSDVDDALPPGWKLLPLSELAHVRRGRSYKGSELAEEGGIPFVNLKCIQRDGGFRRDGLKRFSGDAKPHHFVRRDDIVIAVTDMTQERRIVAQAARIPSLSDPGVFSMDLVKLEIEDAALKEYLYAYWRWSGCTLELRQHANGANVLHLAAERIADHRVPVPPRELMASYAQQAVSLGALAENLAQQNEKLVLARDLLLPKLITGEIELCAPETGLEDAA